MRLRRGLLRRGRFYGGSPTKSTAVAATTKKVVADQPVVVEGERTALAVLVQEEEDPIVMPEEARDDEESIWVDMTESEERGDNDLDEVIRGLANCPSATDSLTVTSLSTAGVIANANRTLCITTNNDNNHKEEEDLGMAIVTPTVIQEEMPEDVAREYSTSPLLSHATGLTSFRNFLENDTNEEAAEEEEATKDGTAHDNKPPSPILSSEYMLAKTASIKQSLPSLKQVLDVGRTVSIKQRMPSIRQVIDAAKVTFALDDDETIDEEDEERTFDEEDEETFEEESTLATAEDATVDAITLDATLDLGYTADSQSAYFADDDATRFDTITLGTAQEASDLPAADELAARLVVDPDEDSLFSCFCDVTSVYDLLRDMKDTNCDGVNPFRRKALADITDDENEEGSARRRSIREETDPTMMETIQDEYRLSLEEMKDEYSSACERYLAKLGYAIG